MSGKRCLRSGCGSSHRASSLSVSLGVSSLRLQGSVDADDAYDTTEFDDVGLDEVQLLLACRAYLIRKHKVEWKEKKRRSEDAASPSNQLGYFWPDPNDLLYLREDPDPYHLDYNETYGEYYGFKRNSVRFLASDDTTYSGKNYELESDAVVEERPSTSNNPFSTNPLSASEETQKRSVAKLKLFNDSKWKKNWYASRWKGRVTTDHEKRRQKQLKLMDRIPNSVLELSESLSDDEVDEALSTYFESNRKKSASRKNNRQLKQLERKEFRNWRDKVKLAAAEAAVDTSNIASTMRDLAKRTRSESMLSFNPSIEEMRRLRKKRSEKSTIAYQTRLANEAITGIPTPKNILTPKSIDTEMRNISNEEREEVSPVQALLHIDQALVHDQLPAADDVRIILKPGRLGRRRDILRKILSQCFGLRGKCVSVTHDGVHKSDELLFTTKCTIQQLGSFVLKKLNEE